MGSFVIMDDELMSCVGDLLDPSYKNLRVINDVAPEITHFSEYYNTNKLPDSLVKSFDKFIKGPTDEEREAYTLHQEAEKIRIDKEIEEDRKRGPAFLSDEWRWARIDAQVEACRDYIRKYG